MGPNTGDSGPGTVTAGKVPPLLVIYLLFEREWKLQNLFEVAPAMPSP
jgi:hypothetical protein